MTRLKNKLLSLLLLTLAFLLLIKPYLNFQFPYTHDGRNHLARFANYKLAMKEGQIPPRFAPNLFSHYGYPVFNYNYPLANILSLPFSFIKINYESSFKIIVIGSLIIAGFALNSWLKLLEIEKTTRLISISIYYLNPFLINLIYFRGNIGEILAMNLLIYIFYILTRLKFQTFSIFQEIITIIFFTGFLLAHNSSVLMALPILLIYALFLYQKNIQIWLKLIKYGLMAGLLSLWFWLPALMEKSLIVLDEVDLSKDFYLHFPTLSQLFFSSLQFGFSFPGTIDSLAFNIGLGSILCLIFTFIYLIKRIHHKQLINKNRLFFFLGSIFLIILQLKISSSFWLLFPLTRYLQFPWRLSLFLMIFLTINAALIIQKIPRHWQLLIIICLVGQLFQLNQLKVADNFHLKIIDYDLFTESTSTNNENRVKTFNYDQIADWQASPMLIQGSGDIQVINWQGSKRSYLLNIKEFSTIVEPTMNFAGWETSIDQQKIKYYDDEIVRGRIAYQLPAGTYQVKSIFTQNTWPRLIGNSLSLFTLFFLIIKCFINKKLILSKKS